MQRGRKEECDVEETFGERIESIIFSKKHRFSAIKIMENCCSWWNLFYLSLNNFPLIHETHSSARSRKTRNFKVIQINLFRVASPSRVEQHATCHRKSFACSERYTSRRRFYILLYIATLLYIYIIIYIIIVYIIRGWSCGKTNIDVKNWEPFDDACACRFTLCAFYVLRNIERVSVTQFYVNLSYRWFKAPFVNCFTISTRSYKIYRA